MNNNRKRMKLYLFLVLGSCYLLGAAAFFTHGNTHSAAYQLLQKGFTAFPVIAAILTRRITKEKAAWRISLKVWKNPKLWAFCALVPNSLIAAGAVLYFILFPEQYSGIFDLGSLLGTEYTIPIHHPLLFIAICILIAAVCIPLQFIELGEEIGWREYLLPKQIAQYGMRKGILLNSFYWGLAHMSW